MRQLFLFSILLSTLAASAQDDILKKGQSIPEFTIVSETGKIEPSSLKQKVVLINFFATWCGPCLSELPVLQAKVWEKYKNNKNFVLLVVGRDHTDAEVQAFKKKYNFDLPMYPDKGKTVYSLFATKYIPRNYLIDKNGKIVYTSMGYVEKDLEEMLAKLDELLK